MPTPKPPIKRKRVEKEPVPEPEHEPEPQPEPQRPPVRRAILGRPYLSERTNVDWLCTRVLSSVATTVNFLREYRLLASNRSCTKCGTQMNEMNEFKQPEGKIWRCPDTDCRAKLSIRNNSFFSDSKLSLKNILILVWCWVHRTTQKFAMEQTSLPIDPDSGSKTAIDWYQFCRDVCREVTIDNGQIGGPGKQNTRKNYFK